MNELELAQLNKLIEKLRETQDSNDVLAEACDIVSFYICIEYHKSVEGLRPAWGGEIK